MKILFLLTSLVYLAACSNDDQENVNREQSLIGSWRATEVWSDDGIGINNNSIPEESSFTLTFNSNNSVIRSDLNEECEEGIYNTTSQIIHFEFPCNLTYEYKIDELTENTLILDTQNFETLLYKFDKVN